MVEMKSLADGGESSRLFAGKMTSVLAPLSTTKLDLTNAYSKQCGSYDGRKVTTTVIADHPNVQCERLLPLAEYASAKSPND